MTWGEFIRAISKSKITKISQPDIVIELFKKAGSIVEVTKSSANHWINNKRNCKVSIYFPNGKITNENDVFNYFRNRSPTSLQNLRSKFHQVGKNETIKCDAEDDNVFCWSILNQFLDLLGFELLEEPIWEIEEDVINSKSESQELNPTPKFTLPNKFEMKLAARNKMVDTFKQVRDAFHIKEVVNGHLPNSESINKIDEFKNNLKREIFEICRELGDKKEEYTEDIFINIDEFQLKLGKYREHLYNNMALDNSDSPECIQEEKQIDGKSVIMLLSEIDSLHQNICEEHILEWDTVNLPNEYVADQDSDESTDNFKEFPFSWYSSPDYHSYNPN